MKKLYDLQKAFFNRINAVEYAGKTHIDRIKDYSLGINKNVSDIINTLDWDRSKEHKTNSVLHQKVEAGDAVVDIIKYAFNVCHEYNIDYEDLMQKFQMKNRTVDQKLKQRQFLVSSKFKNSRYAFIIDIDGVIADIGLAYRQWFNKRLELYHQTCFRTFYEFAKWRSENLDLYKELKEEYRLSGYKATMPEVEGAVDLLRECHKRGIVSLLSNRPVKLYPILYMHTVEFLHNKGMIDYVDMLHFTDFGEKKYFFNRFNEKTMYFIEDNLYNLINTAERPNVTNIFVRNETNQLVDYSFYDAEECVSVNNLQEAISFIKEHTDDQIDNNRRS